MTSVSVGLPEEPPLAVSVRGLVKRYDAVEAVRGVDFDVAPGEVFGFLGPNGAGKSTTINVLCTLVKPTAGTALVAGYDVARQRDQVRRNIGLVFQDTTLDSYLTAEQNLRFHAELYGVPGSGCRPDTPGAGDGRTVGASRQHRHDLLRRHEAAPGDRPRPDALAAGAVPRRADRGPRPADPRLDLGYIQELKRAEDITIFLTTHYMDEAEYCDRIAIMDAGRIVVIDTPEALKASVGKDRVKISTADDAAAIAALRDRFGVEAKTAEGGVMFSVAGGEQFVPRLFGEVECPSRP